MTSQPHSLTLCPSSFLLAILLLYKYLISQHAHVVSILKPGKDPTLPSSYRPINLLDTVGKLFEKILLTRVLRTVNERGFLLDEQFGFRPRRITTLQLEL
jgi:hypothetical protein